MAVTTAGYPEELQNHLEVGVQESSLSTLLSSLTSTILKKTYYVSTPAAQKSKTSKKTRRSKKKKTGQRPTPGKVRKSTSAKKSRRPSKLVRSAVVNVYNLEPRTKKVVKKKKSRSSSVVKLPPATKSTRRRKTLRKKSHSAPLLRTMPPVSRPQADEATQSAPPSPALVDESAVDAVEAENTEVSTSSTGSSLWGLASRMSSKLIPSPLKRRLSGLPSPLSTKGKRQDVQYLLPSQPRDLAGRLTVVLDLDETLIHSEFMGKGRNTQEVLRQAEDRKSVSGAVAPDFSVILYENDPEQEEVVHVYKRPGLEELLSGLASFCEVVIFTASLPVYARPIIDQIDPNRHCRHVLFRDATVKHLGYPHVKSMTRLGRDLRRTILVDNSPWAMCADTSNGVPIQAYYDDQSDTELSKLLHMCRILSELDDVRPFLEQKYNLAQLFAAYQ